MFIKYNPNPTGKKTGDCVVRSLCKALGKSWDEVYKGLCDVGFTMKLMPSANEVWQSVLLQYGFKKQPYKIVKGSKRATVQLCSLSNPLSTCVVSVANHLVCTKDGNYYDTFDSGGCCVYSIFSRLNK